jgi:hypothetical protein
MECHATTAPRYTTASLFICWLIVMDGTGRPHRVVLTVHFCAIEHFRATFDYSYEHYKQ